MTSKMTREKLLDRLRYIKSDIELKNRVGDFPDLEISHKVADNLLLDYINDKDVTKAFNNIEKWYS
jgi:hypothetical protein